MDDEEKCIAALDKGAQSGRVLVRNFDIKALPAAMYFDPRFRKIKTLDLSSNALNTLPDDALKQLGGLNELDVSDNLLRALPDKLPSLLKSLVPPPVTPLRCITPGCQHRLDVSKCMLESLPASIAQLKGLQFLDVQHNCLTALPVELCELPSLHYFGYQGNKKLQFPPAGVLKAGEKAVFAFLTEELDRKRQHEGRRRHAMKALKLLKTELEPALAVTEKALSIITDKAVLNRQATVECTSLCNSLQKEIWEEQKLTPHKAFVEGENHLEGLSRSNDQDWHRSDLAAIRSLKNPPSAVRKAMEAIWILLSGGGGGRRLPGWDSDGQVRSMISARDFISRLFGFDYGDISPEIITRLRKNYFKDTEDAASTIKAAGRASKVAGKLCAWAVQQLDLAEAAPPAPPEGGSRPPSRGRRLSIDLGRAGSRLGTREGAPNLGFAARKRRVDEQRKEHKALLKGTREPLSAAAFELLQGKHAQAVAKLKDLEAEELSLAGLERESRAEMTKLEAQRNEAIEMLETFDINPAAWDRKLNRVRMALEGLMASGPCKLAIFTWWERMVSNQVGKMARSVAQAFTSGDIGKQLSESKLSSSFARPSSGLNGSMPKLVKKSVQCVEAAPRAF